MFIEVNNLMKTYKVAERDKGLAGAFKALGKRKYKYVKAVNDISFCIDKGEIVGYIGPNGAGKSTTIKMLTGILKPDSGTVKIDNMNPFDDRVKYVRNIGVVFGQKSQLWWDIPVNETFDLLKAIYKVSDEEYEKNLKELTEMLDLQDLLTIPVRQLSLGQRMRCEIAASLIHSPEILFLDEPTIGLDAVSKVTLRNFIKEINEKRNVTIILTTHDMTDIETLAKRIIVIGKGVKLYDGELSNVKKKFTDKKRIEIIYKNLKELPTIKNINILKKEEGKVLIEYDTSKMSSSDIISKFINKCTIEDINIYEKNIDEIILELYHEYNI